MEARGSFQVAEEAVFCLGRVLQGPADSRPGERLRLRCGRLGGLKALWCRLEGLFKKQFRLLVVGRALSPRALPPSWVSCYPTPLPHGHELAWAGSGWTGIRYSRPSVWEECRVWNRRERRWLEERARSLRGSVAQDLKKKSRQDWAGHDPVGGKVICCRGPWVGFALTDLASG